MDWIEVKARTLEDALVQAEAIVRQAAKIGKERGRSVAKRVRIVIRSIKSEFLLDGPVAQERTFDGPLPEEHTFCFEVVPVER